MVKTFIYAERYKEILEILKRYSKKMYLQKNLRYLKMYTADTTTQGFFSELCYYINNTHEAI